MEWRLGRGAVEGINFTEDFLVVIGGHVALLTASHSASSLYKTLPPSVPLSLQPSWGCTSLPPPPTPELPAWPAFLQQFSHRHSTLGRKALVFFPSHCLALKESLFLQCPYFLFVLPITSPGWNEPVSEKSCPPNSPAPHRSCQPATASMAVLAQPEEGGLWCLTNQDNDHPMGAKVGLFLLYSGLDVI